MYFTTITVALVGFLFILRQGNTCNEAVCGSLITKCLLLEVCNCTLKNCSCCKDCFACLSFLYSECCSCVDMCPQRNVTSDTLNTKSHVEELTEKIPGLFQVLTEEPDGLNRWTTTTFPVDLNFTEIDVKKEIKLVLQSAEQEVESTKPDTFTLNCTVIYMTQCMGYRKCKNICQSMGATSYRWFHDGCCECVGENCLNYGINESRCKDCPGGKVSSAKVQHHDSEEDDADDGETEE